MDPTTIPGVGAEDEVQRQLLALNGEVSFMRRARCVEEAFNQILKTCRTQREELLGMVKTRLAVLHALAGNWERLTAYLADRDQVTLLRNLYEHLAPTLRSVIELTDSDYELRTALTALVESLQRFNRRWRERLDGLQLDHLNQLRAEYNRYYPLEKEFATRTSANVARRGFKELAPLSPDDFLEWLPLLPVPVLRS